MEMCSERVKSHLPCPSLSPNRSHCHRSFDEKNFRVNGRITKPLQIQCQCTNNPFLGCVKRPFQITRISKTLSWSQSTCNYLFSSLSSAWITFTSLLSKHHQQLPSNTLLQPFQFTSLTLIFDITISSVTAHLQKLAPFQNYYLNHVQYTASLRA